METNDLTPDLNILQDHLDGMLQRLQNNSLLLKRFQVFEMKLLDIQSLPEMIDYLLNDAHKVFDLDEVDLCLIDPKHEIADCLNQAGYRFHDKPNLHLLSDEQALRERFKTSAKPLLRQAQPLDNRDFFRHLSTQPASMAIAPLLRRDRYLGCLSLGSYQAGHFTDDMATDFIEHVMSVIAVCLENNLHVESVRRTSYLDMLTGVNNRRFLEQRILEELDRSQRNGHPLSCLFLDIDFFKHVNDDHGHQAGDFILGQVARIIKRQLRNNDVLARYGGEEFVALLSQSDQAQALEIAERIRRSVAALQAVHNQVQIPITLSIGTATYQAKTLDNTQDVAAKLLQRADDALYQAKRNGRNRVESSPSF